MQRILAWRYRDRVESLVATNLIAAELQPSLAITYILNVTFPPPHSYIFEATGLTVKGTP